MGEIELRQDSVPEVESTNDAKSTTSEGAG